MRTKSVVIANEAISFCLIRKNQVHNLDLKHVRLIINVMDEEFAVTYVGWEMSVKSFANFEEKDAYAFLQNKLTLVKVEGPGKPQYYIYGNTDGTNWQYTQISWEKVRNIDFNSQKTLPIRFEFKALYDEIVMLGAHTTAKPNFDSLAKVKSSEKFMLSKSAQRDAANKFNFRERLFKTLFAEVTRKITPKKRNLDADADRHANEEHDNSKNSSFIKR